MDHEWRRDPEVIEGEYEIIEERYDDDRYTRPRRPFIQIDDSTPYVTYILLAINIIVWLLMSFTEADNEMEPEPAVTLFWCKSE